MRIGLSGEAGMQNEDHKDNISHSLTCPLLMGFDNKYQRLTSRNITSTMSTLSSGQLQVGSRSRIMSVG